jgi:TRAP-type mannitol/chloroaromatic compound transport system substrate-binding protein
MGGFFRKELQHRRRPQGPQVPHRGPRRAGAREARRGAPADRGGDVYPRWSAGTLDAAEFVGPYDDEKLGCPRWPSTTTPPAGGRAAPCCHLVVNQAKWNELPKHYQAILFQACEAANNWMLAKYDAVNAGALRRMIGAGTELRSFPQPIMEASLRAANELYGELSAKSPDFKKGYDSMVAFRGDVLPWWQLNEYAYDTFMVRSRGRA